MGCRLFMPGVGIHKLDDQNQRHFACKYYFQGKADGKIEGKAETLLEILQLRGLEPTDAEREKIMSWQYIKQIKRWLQRALKARSLLAV